MILIGGLMAVLLSLGLLVFDGLLYSRSGSTSAGSGQKLSSMGGSFRGQTGRQYFLDGLHHYTGESGWVDREKARKEFRKAFQKGDPRGAIMYGHMLQYDHRDQEDIKRGKEIVEKWRPRLREMAEQGDPHAKAVLARIVEPGDLERQARLLWEAADKGIAYAQYELALRYRNLGVIQGKKGQRQRPAEAARELFGFAARQGHGYAAMYLGELCELGWGGPKDLEQAEEWFRRALERGTGPNMSAMSKEIWRDTLKIIRFVEPVARRRDSAYYQSYLARLYASEPIHDYETALEWYRRAFDNGDWDLPEFLISQYKGKYGEAAKIAMEVLDNPEDFDSWATDQIKDLIRVELGYLYLQGLGVEQHRERARALFQQSEADVAKLLAAYMQVTYSDDIQSAEDDFDKIFASAKEDVGSAIASAIAQMYHRFGLRRPESGEMLGEIARPLAERGNLRAAFVLGYLDETATGEDSGKDREARKWYRRAAESGVLAAQMRLSLLCLSGDPSPKDREEARKWLEQISSLEEPEETHVHDMKLLAEALMYEYGLGREVDKAEAAVIVGTPSRGNLVYAPAEAFLGDIYEDLYEQDVDGKGMSRALDLYSKASWQEPGVAWKAAQIWNTGKGCDRNIYEAAKYYEMAWAMGMEKAGEKLRELREEFQQKYSHELPDRGRRKQK
jgi:TPR repeat protein